jgi:hypothetical protein
MRLVYLIAPLILLLLPSHATGEPYGWPLDAPPALTSTYAEYRSGRFHAGLDIKTWGKEGYPCLAVDNGYVWRVRTSPWGYGKVVYLRLADGHTAVYAHLSAFSDAIEEVVAEEQDRRGAYSVNLYLPKGQIAVKRGDPIAFSGSTGSGFPHLHFEIRDADQRPLNPLQNGFGVQDTTEPTLVAAAFLPLDADARVDGRAVPKIQALQSENGGSTFGPISVWGRVGVAIKVFDRADASVLTNRLAPYRLTLSVDGKVLFRTTYDAFSYDQVREVDLDRSFALTSAGKKGFHNLYRERGNSLPLYEDRPIGAGVIVAGVDTRPGTHFGIGPHRIEILAEDGVGNRAAATVDFRVIQPVSILDVVVEETKEQRVLTGRFGRDLGDRQAMIVETSVNRGESWDWIKTSQVGGSGFSVPVSKSSGPLYRVRLADGPEAICSVISAGDRDPAGLDVSSQLLEGRSIVTVTSPTILARPPSIEVDQGSRVTVQALSPTQYEFVVPSRSSESVLKISSIDAGGHERDTTLTLRTTDIRPTGGTIASTDEMALAVFDAAGIYHAFEARITPTEVAPNLPSPVGKAYRFEPGTIPFRLMAQVHLKPPSGTDISRLGIYELTDKGWAFVWNDVDSVRNTVWAGVRHFSVYALLEDDIPPKVEIQEPANGVVTHSKPSIRVALSDSMSGIPMEQLISFKLDEKTLIFEYDPEEDLAKGLLRQPLSPGNHSLEVRVHDTSGNETVVSSQFVVASE